MSRVSCLLSYQQKKFVTNSFICGQASHCPLIWMFTSIRSYRKINKLHERSLGLCQNDYNSSYDNLLGKQSLVNIHLRNIQQLMIEISKCLKSLFPSTMNEILNQITLMRYHKKSKESRQSLAKDHVLGLESITYKGPQLWQQLPAKIKKLAPK